MRTAGLRPIGYYVKGITHGVAVTEDTHANMPVVMVELTVVMSVGEKPQGWRRWVWWLIWAAAAGACVFMSVMGRRG